MRKSPDHPRSGSRQRQRLAVRKIVNAVTLGITVVATLVALAPLLWVIGDVIARGARALTPAFFTEAFKPVSQGAGGVVHAIAGTAILVGLACLISIPIGVLAAIFAVRQRNSRFGTLIRFATDVLAGLPSIVVGLFIYVLMVGGRGYSALSGSVALAIMMLPIVERSTEEMLKLVPGSLREGSLGLGSPEWKAMAQVVIPAATSGIVTGVLLAVSRVAGEAAPLLLTAQGSNVLSTQLDRPIAALPLTMFKYATDPDPVRNAQAWAIALLLVVLVLILNLAARAITARRPAGL